MESTVAERRDHAKRICDLYVSRTANLFEACYSNLMALGVAGEAAEVMLDEALAEDLRAPAAVDTDDFVLPQD